MIIRGNTTHCVENNETYFDTKSSGNVFFFTSYMTMLFFLSETAVQKFDDNEPDEHQSMPSFRHPATSSDTPQLWLTTCSL